MQMCSWILILEIVGTINALYLTVAAFNRHFMIPWFNYRGRQKRIADLGYHALPLPCFWFGRAVNSAEDNSWCGKHSVNVPVALLGAVTYISLTLIAIFEAELHGFCQDCGFAKLGLTPLVVSWVIALIGVLFSGRMMYLMFVKIPKLVRLPVSKVWCVFCVISASTMCVVFVYNTVGVLWL